MVSSLFMPLSQSVSNKSKQPRIPVRDESEQIKKNNVQNSIPHKFASHATQLLCISINGSMNNLIYHF